MVVLGKKIVKIILYFLKTKKVFRAPKKAKILVYDEAKPTHALITEFIDQHIHPTQM